MTISIAWTRKEHNIEQLVFASDSRISAGEKFDACPKMLALPRTDCAISYAGTSGDALSMMLQLSLAIQSYPAAMKLSLELSALKSHAIKIFNAMLKEIKLEQIRGNPSTVRTNASFLFGGYSWRRRDFEFWSLRYAKTTNEFISRPPMILSVNTETNKVSTETRPREKLRPLGRIAVVGDQTRAAEKLLIRLLNQKLETDPRMNRLHMEPFEVIRELLRNRNLRGLPDRDSIGGAPQLMKVFQYCQTASFAVRWPDSDGTIRPFLNGRPCLDYENLDILCLDPDTFQANYLGNQQTSGMTCDPVLPDSLDRLADGASETTEPGDSQRIVD